MAEIGATLREARMRQRIDITDMEVRTKIRAKYLRALENEEWDLLPGPTYVRSFLRTYAEALGLDAKLLVEEYKLRHDPLETGELHPIRRPTQRDREQRRHDPRGFPRGAILGLVLAAIVAALFFIGQGAPDDDPPEQVTSTPAETTATEPEEESEGQSAEERAAERRRRRRAAERRAVVRLQIVPSAPVSVCLTNINGEVLVDNEILQPGGEAETFRSKRFRLVLGTNAATLRINGTPRTLPATPGPVAYTITKNGRSDLPPERRPTCSG